MKWDPLTTHTTEHRRRLFRKMVMQAIESSEDQITKEIISDVVPKSLEKCKHEIREIFKKIYGNAHTPLYEIEKYQKKRQNVEKR